MFRIYLNGKTKTDSIVVPKTLPPSREFATVLNLTFIASQIGDIVSIIQVLRLVTIVSMINDEFDDTR